VSDTPDTRRQTRTVPAEGRTGHLDPSSPTQQSATGRLLRALAVMASGTMLSKILGFARVALASYVIGNGSSQADMYAVATTIPTALYILFAGGALNSVLVPQLTRAAKHDPDGGEAYTNRIITAFMLILLVVTLVMTVAAPAVTTIYSADSWRAPGLEEHYRAMVLLTMVCLPEIFFYGTFVVLGQVLNARDRFGPMMWAPVASNVIQVGSFVTFLLVWGISNGKDPFTSGQIAVLGGGYVVGMVLQAAVMVVCLRKAGYHYKPRFDLKGTGLGKTFKLAGWAVGFVLVNQVSLAVVSRLATSATAGGSGAGLTVYNNAYLVFLLPHSLITVSLATAMVTSASKLVAAGDLTGTAQEVTRTMRLVTTALVPAAALFVALAHPLANLLFGHGTGAGGAGYIAWTIIAFAVGLVPFTIQHICLRTYYALEQNRMTFFLQVAIAAVQIAAALALVLPFDNPAWVAPALALAFSVAYLFGLLISFRLLRTHLPALHGGEVLRHIVRVFVAVLPGAIIAWLIARWLDDSTLFRLLGLAAGGLIAAGGYLLAARVLHIREITEITGRLRGRRQPAAEDGEALMATRIRPAIRLADEPDADHEDTQEVAPLGADQAGEDTAEEDHPIRVRPGRVLGDRYQLEQVLVRRSRTQTWRALDRVLSRPVLIHLLPYGEDDQGLLATAKKAAVATDSRFLRVLDAQPADESVDPDADPTDAETPLGAYIVCEYAAGQSLERLLADGPLSALEAAWLVREVADALGGMHERRLYHERINPDTVVITATGNVKIVGFLLESEFGPTHHPLTDGSDPEAVDVIDLGRLLYCALVSRWPGGHGYGMAAAPVDFEDHLLTPRQVRAGVSPALDTICDRILSPVPRHRETPLRTAQGIVRALNQVLGTADAAHDLERRLRYPVPVVEVGEAEPAVSVPDRTGVETSAGTPLAPFADPDAPTGPIPVHSAEDEVPTGLMPPVSSSAPVHLSTPVSPPTPSEPRRPRPPEVGVRPDPPRRWIPILILLTVLTLVGGLVAVAVNFRGGDQPRTAEATPQRLTIVRADDFDPEGADKAANPEQVPFAWDGDPETAWLTEVYAEADMTNKDGTGVMFDLGSVREISRADLLLDREGISVRLLVPTTDPATLTTAPMDDITQWRPVASAEPAPVSHTLTPAQPVRTRFVVVMLTEVPGSARNYQGGIAEAVFWE
jgi:putative peptidoglycan lipid II flippase